jgi:hypothetical protein
MFQISDAGVYLLLPGLGPSQKENVFFSLFFFFFSFPLKSNQQGFSISKAREEDGCSRSRGVFNKAFYDGDLCQKLKHTLTLG